METCDETTTEILHASMSTSYCYRLQNKLLLLYSTRGLYQTQTGIHPQKGYKSCEGNSNRKRYVYGITSSTTLTAPLTAITSRVYERRFSNFTTIQYDTNKTSM